MKNYLFAPFKDDDDKIREFNAMFKALTHLIDADHELHVIRVFVCRLESTHDAIIQDMHNNKAEIVDGLLEESNLLKAEVERYKFHAETRANELVKRGAKLKELQAEINVYIKTRDKRIDMIKELKAENMRLNDKDGLYDEVKELQAENKTLRVELDKVVNSLKESREEGSRLMKQVSSNRGNSSSTHTHTLGSVNCSIAREIAEYMNNNPKSKGARMFLLPRCDFKKDGEHDGGYFYWEDGME